MVQCVVQNVYRRKGCEDMNIIVDFIMATLWIWSSMIAVFIPIMIVGVNRTNSLKKCIPFIIVVDFFAFIFTLFSVLLMQCVLPLFTFMCAVLVGVMGAIIEYKDRQDKEAHLWSKQLKEMREYDRKKN